MEAELSNKSTKGDADYQPAMAMVQLFKEDTPRLLNNTRACMVGCGHGLCKAASQAQSCVEDSACTNSLLMQLTQGVCRSKLH